MLFVSNEYIVFTMGGTIALRLSIQTFYDWRATDLQLEKGLTLLLYKFEFHAMMFALKLDKKISLNFVNAFPLFRYYLPLGKGMTLYLNKLEFSLPKNT